MEFVVGMASGVGGWIMKMQAQKLANQQEMMKLAVQKVEVADNSMDRAAARGSVLLRRVVGFTVMIAAFGGLLVVAFFPDIPVSIVKETGGFELFGFRFGGGLKVIEAQGLVIEDWFRLSVVSIVHFLFGQAAAKA
jgi:hypothetical protein